METLLVIAKAKEWKRITSADEVQVGDIVFTGKLDNEGKRQAMYLYVQEKEKDMIAEVKTE